MRKENDLSQDMIEGFKRTIFDMVQQCRCLYDYQDWNGFDNFLMYQPEDYKLIGCVDGESFLLDSDVIYKTFQHCWNDVRRHIVVGANRTLISVLSPLRWCRTGTCRRLLAE